MISFDFLGFPWICSDSDVVAPSNQGGQFGGQSPLKDHSSPPRTQTLGGGGSGGVAGGGVGGGVLSSFRQLPITDHVSYIM